MKYQTPEKCGLSSEHIIEFIEKLEKCELSNHSLILARGDEIIFEGYWKPFDENFLHRMYSVTKSFTSLAIGFLEQDGLINLDEKLFKYFPEESKNQTDEYMKGQTIRDMLMMSTAKIEHIWWFRPRINDRLQSYFDNDRKDSRPTGTIYNYDSQGSFVLGALVEKVTGKLVVEYLREKLFDKIGVSKEAYMLKCPGGHSWADSALLCTPMDLFKTARFVLNKGKWNGEQILNERYINEATKKQIDNNLNGENNFDTQGYGYQIWRTFHNGFFFNGMGCQFAVCMPEKDFIMIYTADNQGKAYAKKDVFDNFFEIIYNNIHDEPLAENKEGNEKLEKMRASLTLNITKGEKKSEFAEKINGIKFKMGENKMGITEFSLNFSGDEGKFNYKNVQGDKTIKFGFGKNVFGIFPEEGYSDMTGTEITKDFYYKYCASACWKDEKRLFIKLHIVDKYLGNSNITIAFKDENNVALYMKSNAEAFLEEYNGIAGGKRA